MENRREKLANIRKTLEDCGFELTVQMETGSLCFDIMARKENTLIIIKVLSNVDSQSQGGADELKSLGFFLKGIPLLIGERTTKSKIETGVLYLRHGVTIMNFETLSEFLKDGVPPVAFSAPGGFYVEVDGEKLRSLRELRGISYGDLSRVVGVSRKSIQMYESGKSASIDIGLRMEEYFNTQIIRPLDPLVHKPEAYTLVKEGSIELDKEEKEVYRHLEGIGYKVRPTARCPFDAYTHKTSSVILTAVGDRDLRIKDRLKSLSTISDISQRDAILVTTKEGVSIKEVDIPVVKKEVLKKMEDPDEIMDFIKNY
jgi:putative transcriptional regulator